MFNANIERKILKVLINYDIENKLNLDEFDSLWLCVKTIKKIKIILGISGVLIDNILET